MTPPSVKGRAPVPALSRQTGSFLPFPILESPRQRTAATLVLAVVLGALAWWTHWGVEKSVREFRAAALSALLDVQVSMLRAWIGEEVADAEALAGEARVSGALAKLSPRGCDTASARAFAETLRPILKGERLAAVVFLDPEGVVLAVHPGGRCGARLDGFAIGPGGAEGRSAPASAVGAAAPGSTGPGSSGDPAAVRPPPGESAPGAPTHTPFVPSSREAAYRGTALAQQGVSGGPDAPAAASRFMPSSGPLDTAAGATLPLSWIVVPTGRDGAVLALGRRAEEGFGAILAAAQPGETGEAYLFDAGGRIVAGSRHGAALREAIPEFDGPVRLRDPGGDLRGGHRPGQPRDALPPTRLAAAALDAAAGGKPGRAVILDPYRNYLGAEVIGAWAWIPEYGLGVAVEVGAREAYAPLAYVNVLVTVLLLLLAAAVVAALALARRSSEPGAQRVGQYRLGRLLGEGGMSRVYQARHLHLKRPAALKMLKVHMATDEMLARFRREVQQASRLAHPNIVEIYDYGNTTDGGLYYAMEYIEGLSLGQLVEKKGAVPPGRAAFILRQAALALAEIHAQGLVHRDIKPENIMLCRRSGQWDTVKVLDFGLVKDLQGGDTRDVTQHLRILGTPLYMSPERIRNPADADARADLYALGAVGFLLVTGRRLFETATEIDLTHEVLHTPPPRASAVAKAELSAELDDLLWRCVAKDREARPASAQEVVAVLDRVLAEASWTAKDAERWWNEFLVGISGPV